MVSLPSNRTVTMMGSKDEQTKAVKKKPYVLLRFYLSQKPIGTPLSSLLLLFHAPRPPSVTSQPQLSLPSRSF